MLTTKKSHANRISCAAFQTLALSCCNLPTIACNCACHAWLCSIMCQLWSFMANKIGDPLIKKGTPLYHCLCCRFDHAVHRMPHVSTNTFSCAMSIHLQCANIKVRITKWRENLVFYSFLRQWLPSRPLPTQSVACTFKSSCNKFHISNRMQPREKRRTRNIF